MADKRLSTRSTRSRYSVNLDALTAIADVNITPIGFGCSISAPVAEAVLLFQSRGLRCNVHALGTNIEGPLPVVLDAIRECHQELHRSGVGRLVTRVVLSTRIDRGQTLEEKIEAVNSKLQATTAQMSGRRSVKTKRNSV